ncbi:MAG: LapA family protein [Candidatus Nanopelagicales bacterium]
MAEPINPNGPEPDELGSAPTPDVAPAVDPSASGRSLDQVDRMATTPEPAHSGPEVGGDLVPAGTHVPTPGPDSASEPDPAPKVKQPLPAESLAKTRAAAAWLATGAALIIVVLMIILILQNQETMEFNYLWFSGRVPIGAALVIAAVTGAAIVMIVGIVRLTQVRRNTRRAQKAANAQHLADTNQD